MHAMIEFNIENGLFYAKCQQIEVYNVQTCVFYM